MKKLANSGAVKQSFEFTAVLPPTLTIATTTYFNGNPLLQGGGGPGGEFEISFQVGSGLDEHAKITVLFATAMVSDLSVSLTTNSLAI